MTRPDRFVTPASQLAWYVRRLALYTFLNTLGIAINSIVIVAIIFWEMMK